MLALAQKYEPLLRSVGIDPEEVKDIQLVLTNGEHLGQLKVRLQPKTQYVKIKIEKVDG